MPRIITYGNTGFVSPRHDAFIGRGFLALTIALDRIEPADPARIAQCPNAGITGPGHEERTTWVHVAPFGEWKGHSRGAFSLTRERFAAVCAQIAKRVTPISVDYEHASIQPKGDATPAAGYVLAGEVRDDGLYALTEFTQRAAGMIKAAEYRFSSGVFDFEAVDGQTGEPLGCALDTIALTNRPFIDGQNPIVLTRRVPLSAGASMNKIQIADLLKILKSVDTGDGLTADQITGALSLLASGKAGAEPPPAADKAEASKPTGGAVALTDPTPPAPAVALGDMPPPAAPVVAADPPMPPMDDADNDEAVDEFDAKLMADLGISDADAYAALLMQNYDAIKALLVGGDAAGSVAMSRDLAIKGLTSQLEVVTKERNQLVAEQQRVHAAACATEVDQLIRRAPALAGERESMIALAKTAPKEFRRMAAALAPTTPPLTAPHAVALTKPTDPTPPVTVADDHPRLVAQRVSLAHAGIKGDAAERIIATVRKQIAESAG